MQTLGVSETKERDDGRLKSIFWPTVQNAWDVDHLGRQGFWICIITAAYQLIVSVASGNTFVMIAGIATALVFVLGGMGVREGSWPAAALVFAIFFDSLLYGLATLHFPGILAIIATGMLLSNVRAAFLASEWKPPAEGEDRPARFNETWGDKLADQLPAKAWPILQVPFYGFASLLLLLTVVGLGLVLLQRLGVVPHAGSTLP